MKTKLGELCIKLGKDVIANNKDEPDKMKYFAIVIQKLERELGIKVSSFPELSLMTLQSFSRQSRIQGTRTNM